MVQIRTNHGGVREKSPLHCNELGVELGTRRIEDRRTELVSQPIMSLCADLFVIA